MKHDIDPCGQRLPIKLDTTSDGEFVPVPLSSVNRATNYLAQQAATVNVRLSAEPDPGLPHFPDFG